MTIKHWTQEIETNLKLDLRRLSPSHKFTDVMEYSLLPAGKYFRPLLCYALANDLEGTINKNQKLFASSLEMHHTYTLIHDDLPAMDDDDMRRGRMSSHKKFSEANAILAGDALLTLSLELLAEIDSPILVKQMLKLYTQSTGANGLILGQVKDLQNENETFTDILLIHELKTARLIQLALRGANLLSSKPIQDHTPEDLGLKLGINFQLLDDLCELTEPVNGHELEINPFFKFSKEVVLNKIKENNNAISNILNLHNLDNTRDYINIYLDKIKNKLINGKLELNKHLKISEKDIVEITR